jgi:4-hydroxybutyrate CoA-transferase
MIRYKSAEESIETIKNGERIFIHGGAATPAKLVEALVARNNDLKNAEVVHLHTEGPALYAQPEYAGSFTVNSFFIGANIRPYVNHTNVQYIPVFLSEIPAMFRRGKMPVDTALIQVSEPDAHGYCSLGVSVDVTKAATDTAKKIIALINPNMPRSHGDGLIHSSRFSSAVHGNDPIYECNRGTLSEAEGKVGKYVASLIEDGSALQMGIGGIPDAVLHYLRDHKNLGIHTEMFSDGILSLVESGAVNGSMKRKHPGKIVSSFAMGTRKLYDFIHDNPMVAMLDSGYVNDASVISKNDRAVAINCAIEINLTGQVCADSIGNHIFSGVGGQMDFMRGASLSEGGKPIIALTSETSRGISKIVPMLKPGAGVVTTRAHVHYVVTEFGIADLYGKNISQRAKALIAIAHPAHREELESKAREMFG